MPRPSYAEAMRALNEAAYAAVRAAREEQGHPRAALIRIALDVDSLIDHGATVAERQA